MKVAVAQMGARMHYAVPRVLNDDQKLEVLYTDLAANKFPLQLLQMIPGALMPEFLKKMSQRLPLGISAQKIVHHPFLGISYALAHRKASTQDEEIRNYIEGAKQFNAFVLKNWKGNSDVVYAFNTVAMELFQNLDSGVTKIVEQTIAPYQIERQILTHEYEQFPNWSRVKLAGEMSPTESEYAQRELKELELADQVVCASGFVSDSIGQLGLDQTKVRVLPYGYTFSGVDNSTSTTKDKPKKLQGLFVGRIGLRKGIQYLTDAAKELKEVAEITAVGPVDVSDEGRAEIAKHIHLVGPKNRMEVAKFYQQADFFVLPSLCEGSATVIYEALAFSLPIITTANAGSIIEHGKEGFIVPIRQSEAIVEAVLKLTDDELRTTMRKAAAMKYKDGTFEAYAERLKHFFENL